MIARMIFIGALAFSFLAFAGRKEKTYPFDQWRQTQLDSANTAKDVDYLSDEEKQVVFYTNLARINPELFAKTYAQKYIDSSKIGGGSLVYELKHTTPVPALQVDKTLCETASSHAKLSGITGLTGHGGKIRRVAKSRPVFNMWGENCQYGWQHALDIVMDLLIDQGIKGLGHRKNILHKDFTHIGTGIRRHWRYRWNCVQDFGGTFVPEKK